MPLGRVLSVEILRPGNAALIVKNGWPCSHPGCSATPTVEVRFTRVARGVPGYVVGCHGACDAHAEEHARSLEAESAAECARCGEFAPLKVCEQCGDGLCATCFALPCERED
jgi:hypothetical protein